MRAGAYTVHQSLTAEAAAVLKLSLGLARRRGHAQVTPLHVAYTLLGTSEPPPSPRLPLFTTTISVAASTPTPAYGLLMRACARSRSQSQTTHHPAQCRALELCFNVALNRLPTGGGNNAALLGGSSPSAPFGAAASLLHQPCPTLSNALVAALKRAQANQRRGCVELQSQPPPSPPPPGPQQQQQPMLTIKVELEQLIVSILDDPSVSRVMREAGFSSAAVKSSLEEESAAMLLHGSSSTAPSYSPAPHFFLDPYGGGGGFPAPSSAALWAGRFMNHPPWPAPPDVESGTPCSGNKAQDDVRAILEVMTGGQGRRVNPVVVGDSVSVAEACVAELMRRMERGDDVTGELRGARVLRLHLSHVHVRLMTHADVDAWTADLRRSVADSTTNNAGAAAAGLVIYVGDMCWAVDDGGPGGLQAAATPSPAARLAAELARLLGELRLRGGRAWLVAAASYGTFMRCQRSSSLEVAWDLQPVAVPAGGGLDLELGRPRARAASQADGKVTQPAHQFPRLDLALAPKEGDSVPMPLPTGPTLCAECAEYYESEASAVTAKAQGTNLALTFFPGWPQADEPQTSHKNDLMELKRKWSRLCQLRVHSFHGRSKLKHQDVKTTLSLLPESVEASDEDHRHESQGMHARPAAPAQEPDAAAATKPSDMKSAPWLSTCGELPAGDLKRKAQSVRMPSECDSAKRWKGSGGLDLNLSADDDEDGGSGSSEDELVPSDLTNDDGEEARGDVTDSLDSHCQAEATFDH